jgi:hypothetical protein
MSTKSPPAPAPTIGRYSVTLFSEQGLPKQHAEQVVALFERHPGPVAVSLISRPTQIKAEGPDGTLLWSDTFAAMRSLRDAANLPADAFIFLLTKTNNEDNWYATEDPGNMRNGFGHVGDFSWVTSAPSHAITAHYVLKAIFNALVTEAGIPWMSLWHQEPRGCFYDFCSIKTDLNFKLRTADICGDCMEIFQSIGIPDALLAQAVTIMEATRRMAVNTGQFLSAPSEFQEWPFPVAITRHKAVQATNPLLRFMLLLDHFDSLVRYFYLAHEIVGGRQPDMEERPSLGWWVDKLANSLKGEKHFRQVVSIAQQEKVVALRNEKRGHGWMAANEEAYREEGERLERVLDQIEHELRPFLEKYRLVVPRQIQLREVGFIVEGDKLTGSHVLHPNFSITLKADPRTHGLKEQHKVYLTDNNMEQFHPMDPYIRHGLCPECNHPRVLITDGGNQYIDAFVGHRISMK